MTSTTVSAAHQREAADFVAAVRERLSDLPAGEIDELLEDLEGDLVERLADDGELGDAAAYADELRRAAGLPDRVAQAKPAEKPRRTLAESLALLKSSWDTYWAATPGRVACRDFAGSLMPLWWVIRALLAVWLIWFWLGWVPAYGGVSVLWPTPGTMLASIAAIIVSVQWGRGKWLPKRWLVRVYRALNIFAVVALVPSLMVMNGGTLFAGGYEDDEEYYDTDGLVLDGEQTITNIYAYDCTGKPLNGVQLFDQDGEPVTTLQLGSPAEYESALGTVDEDGWESKVTELNPLAASAKAWNVFPLSAATVDEDGNRGAIEPAQSRTTQVQALGDDCNVSTDKKASADDSAKAG